MGEVLCSTENSPFLIIDHIHAKINRVCCAALAIGKKCMNVRKNKLLYIEETLHKSDSLYFFIGGKSGIGTWNYTKAILMYMDFILGRT